MAAHQKAKRPTVWLLTFLVTSSCLRPLVSSAEESWPAVLARMPLPAGVRELNRTNCVALMLAAFQSNVTVKALVFMPGATDEFYMFRRAKAELPSANVSLLDAVSALTNQTLIRVTFLPPLLLLHTDEDPLTPDIRVEHEATAAKYRTNAFAPHLVVMDRDWDFVQPLLRKKLKKDVWPWRRSYESWHFYRHNFAGWNLTAWETLEAVALAGKTRFTIQRRHLVFEGDERVRATPKFDGLRP